MDNSDSRLPSGELAFDLFAIDVSLEHIRKEAPQRRVIQVVGYCPLDHLRESLNVELGSPEEPCIMTTLPELQDLIKDNHESITAWIHAPKLSIAAFILPLDDPQAHEFIAHQMRLDHEDRPFWPSLRKIIWIVPHGCVAEDVALYNSLGVAQRRVPIDPREPKDPQMVEAVAAMRADEARRKVMVEVGPLLRPIHDMRKQSGDNLPS
jgi:hypothetical protein